MSGKVQKVECDPVSCTFRFRRGESYFVWEDEGGTWASVQLQGTAPSPRGSGCDGGRGAAGRRGEERLQGQKKT